ncbi:DUF4199 domain-containing protein [Pollutibacter soli]|uniref:DUF4199 domain-containing protein n=1 Tax=Pollutibacter soli TaxID=3034157 RepID=UPI0030135097
MEKKPVTHFIAGIIIAAVMIVYSLVLMLMDLSTNQAAGFVSYVILLAGVIYFVLQYAKAMDNTLTFGNLFSYGFKSTAIATLILLAFQVIFFVAFPEYKDKITEMSRENMIKQGQLSEEQIDQAMAMMQRFFWVGLIGGTVFFCLIIGAIASLIGAGLAKKNPQTPFQNPL